MCTNLHWIAFLEEYKYDKSSKCIRAKTSKDPKAIKFLTGEWLEYYVKNKVLEAVRSLNLPVDISYLKNLKIVLSNGDQFEMDLLFKIGDNFFWFETKTGDYQKYIGKYSKFRKLLELDQNHTYLILTDIAEAAEQALCSLFKMTVIDIRRFYDSFKFTLEQLYGAS